MLRMDHWTVFLFIGLCLVCPGCGEFDDEFTENNNLPIMLSRVNPILSMSEDLKNLNGDEIGFSGFNPYEDLIPLLAFYQYLQQLFSYSGDNRCFQDIKYAFQHPLDHDQLGVKMLDAFGKLESGILEGNNQWFGNFHECTSIHAPPDTNSTGGDFDGQYCTLAMTSEVLNRNVSISLGVCLPDSCGSVPLKSFNVSELASYVNITKKTCQPTTHKLTSAAVGVIFLLSFFVLLALVGSSITVYEYLMQTDSQDASVPYQEQTNEGDTGIQILESPSKAASTPNKSDNNGWYGTAKGFFNCFCIFTNGEKLLTTGGSEGQLLCLHGIRFLSMVWVIACHAYGMILVGLHNFLEAGTELDTFFFEIILNGYYSVDSFFLLSGFLVAYLYFKQAAKTNGKIPWLYFYVHRFIRLTPVYMVVLGFYTALNYYIGTGPLWTLDAIEPVCRYNWWYNILYINNLASGTRQCMPWTWYLANDMQFFVLSPLLLISLWRWPKIGYTIMGLFMSITVAANLGITYHYGFRTGYGGGSSIGDLDFQALMAENKEFYNLVYEKPYTRMSSYLVGIALAYYLFKRKQNNEGKLSLVPLICGWIIATTVSLACIFSPYHRRLSVVESAFSNAFGHAAFTSGIAWVIFLCLNKQAELVDRILSFKIFIPLSRLTYCAYLIHPLIIAGYFQSMKTTFYFSQITMITLFLGLLVITYFFAFIVSVLFESPIIRLEKFLMTKFKS